MPLTVMQHWQQERDLYEQAQTAAQNDLTAAQLALATAKSNLTADLKTFSDLGTKIQEARAKLATTTVPADVVALNLKIRNWMIQQRTAQGAVLDDHDAVDWAQASADAATAVMARTTARLADAEAKLTAAKEANRQRQAMRTALFLAPFDTLQADANTLGSTTKPNADATMAANFPGDMLKIAGLRHARRVEFLDDRRGGVELAETAVGSAANTDGGKDGAAANAGVAFRQAERNVKDYVASAKQRYDKAAATLRALEAIKLDPTNNTDVLTAAQKTDVNDAGQAAARSTAEGNAEPIDTDRGTVETALKALDAQIITAIQTDVDTLSSDAGVTAKRTALVGAVQTLKADQDTFVAGDKATLDAWEAIVPDPAWQTVVDYYAALATVDDLKTTKIHPATDADSLIKILDDAEKAYGDALAAAAKARRRADYLADQVTLRQARLDAATTAYSARALSAVRGDSF
jgi:hypothetical protein